MNDKDRVIFKLTPGDRQVIAFLPDYQEIAFLPDYQEYTQIMCYMHMGQHGTASLEFYWECTPARPDQYAALKAELESIGYNLDVKRRLSSKWYHNQHLQYLERIGK